MSEILDEIFDDILDGNIAGVKSHVQAALDAGLAPGAILNEGMIAAMSEVGQRYERGEIYVSEMLISARTLQAGLAILKPHLRETNVKATGKVIIGTVRGDLHDIGKNLVGIMLKGAGFEVVDLGADVHADAFVDAAVAERASIIGMSALLTTTMSVMKDVVDLVAARGLRSSVKIMVGGAPVSADFAREIGADAYAFDAASAVDRARTLMA